MKQHIKTVSATWLKQVNQLWITCVWAIISIAFLAFCLSALVHTMRIFPVHEYILNMLQSELPDGPNTCMSSNGSQIQWIHTLQNKHNNKTIDCSWETFNYLPAIAKQLHIVYGHRKFNNKCGINSQFINTRFTPKKHTIHTPYVRATYPRQYLRLKSLNGALYLSSHPNIELTYRFAWWLYYFMRLFEKYGQFIPNTDFIIYMGDTGSKPFDWKIFPFFVGDATEIHNKPLDMHQLPLFTLPRSYIWLHQTPVDGYAEVVCYRDSDGFNDFERKKNAAIFRGAPTGGFWKKSKRGKVIMTSTDHNITYIDAKFTCSGTEPISSKYCSPYITAVEQMKYKYNILLDGNSVRDAFPKQLSMNAVVLKQKSSFKEFWYYNLMDQEHMIEWKDMKELNRTVYELVNGKVDVDKQREIARKGRAFVDEYLRDECMDCFVIHMIQLYNHYFFNERGVELAAYDTLINKESIRSLLHKGYGKHIYGYQYHCASNNQTIVSQKYVL
eukprot:446859_1